MSFYRTLLAAIAAIAIASPVFADDAAATQGTTDATPAVQTNDTAAATDKSASATEEKTTDATDAKVNLNKASAKELVKVKGLNAAKARAIVAYRKKHGDFKSVDELVKVKGFKKIKANTLKGIEDQLTVE